MAGTRTSERSSHNSSRRQDGSEESRAHQGGRASPWEWAVAALSAAVALGAVGFLIYEALTGAGSPPDMEIQVDGVTQVTGGYLVQITVRNVGQATASAVTVEGTLMSGAQTVETSEATFDYVPVNSTRAGGLFFTRDPAAHTLEVRALGYSEP